MNIHIVRAEKIKRSRLLRHSGAAALAVVIFVDLLAIAAIVVSSVGE